MIIINILYKFHLYHVLTEFEFNRYAMIFLKKDILVHHFI